MSEIYSYDLRQKVLVALDNGMKKQFIDVDEAGINNTQDYPYGWCERGQQFETFKPGHCSQKVSMIAALQENVLIAPMTFDIPRTSLVSHQKLHPQTHSSR